MFIIINGPCWRPPPWPGVPWRRPCVRFRRRSGGRCSRTRRWSPRPSSLTEADSPVNYVQGVTRLGSIFSLGHKFQIWGQIWPPRLFGGHSGLKTSLLRTSIWNLEVLLTKFKSMEVFLTKFKILQKCSLISPKIPQKFSKNLHKSPKNQILYFPPCQPQVY